MQGFVKDTTFSHKRGFYDEAFQLEVTTATPGATISIRPTDRPPGRRARVSAAPDPDSPPVLSLTISTTTIVRAYAEKPGYESTNIDTQTYLFLDQVIGEPTMSTTITQDPVWGPQMRDALLEIPSISLVTQEEIPTEPIMSPPEIPVSIEMIFPDGRDGFQADVGIERFGGQYTVLPETRPARELQGDLRAEAPQVRPLRRHPLRRRHRRRQLRPDPAAQRQP